MIPIIFFFICLLIYFSFVGSNAETEVSVCFSVFCNVWKYFSN